MALLNLAFSSIDSIQNMFSQLCHYCYFSIDKVTCSKRSCCFSHHGIQAVGARNPGSSPMGKNIES
jgi:hypothetical protein